MARKKLDAELERAKNASAAQLLIRAGRLVDECGLSALKAAGESRVGGRHTRLFLHIDLEGTRITVIAERAGITKQAVDQAVGELEAVGILRRSVDPSDARARLVRFTAAGRRAIMSGLNVLAGVDDELADRVGRARVDRLRKDLAVLVRALESD